MKRTIYSCDVCRKELEGIAYIKEAFDMQVVFTTEQNEGRSTDHYLSNVKMDICNTCLDRTIEGERIFASGAMGHNTYSFKKD